MNWDDRDDLDGIDWLAILTAVIVGLISIAGYVFFAWFLHWYLG